MADRRLGDDADSCVVGGRGERIFVQKQAAAGIKGETSRTGLLHGIDGVQTNHRHIEAHILVGLGDLDHGERSAQGRGFLAQRRRLHNFASAKNCCVGAFHRFHGNASGFGNDHGLTDVEAREMVCDRPSVGDVGLLGVGGGALGQGL